MNRFRKDIYVIFSAIVLLLFISLEGLCAELIRVGSLNRRINAGLAYLEVNEYKKAKDQFIKALQVKPDLISVLINLAIVYYYESHYEKALQEIDKSLKIDPNNPYSRFIAGFINLKMGLHEKAIYQFNKVKAIVPDDPAVFYYLGAAYENVKNGKEAEESFQQAIKIAPLYKKAHYRLGNLLIRSNRPAEGEIELLTFNVIKISNKYNTIKSDFIYKDNLLKGVRENPAAYEKMRKEILMEYRIGFSDVTEESGIYNQAKKNSDTGKKKAVISGKHRIEQIKGNTLIPSGSALTLFDFNNDGYLDLYIARASLKREDSVNTLYRNNGDGTFTDVTKKAGVGDDGAGMGVAAADYDNDGNTDLYVTNLGKNILYRNNGDGTFADVTNVTGVGDKAYGMRSLFVDFNHDGFLDIFTANFMGADGLTRTKNVLYKNDGKKAYKDVTEKGGITGKYASSSVFISDLDNDRDIDILVSNTNMPPKFYGNNRDETFEDFFKNTGLNNIKGTSAVYVDDYNADRIRDIFLLSPECQQNRLFIGAEDGSFKEQKIASAGPGTGGQKISSFDYDNDGDLDLFISGACSQHTRGYLLLENNGEAMFKDVSTMLPITDFGKNRLPFRGNFALGDYDNDGDIDIFLIEDGDVNLLRNNIGEKNNWLNVALTGALGNSRDGIGALVKIRAGDLWLKKEVNGLTSGSSQGNYEVHFGLGKREIVDRVEVIWPTGIKQVSRNIDSNQLVNIVVKGQKSSCPFIFAWDGSRYTFITDFLGAGFIGILTGPDTYYKPDPDEYIKLEREKLKPKDGKYLIKITEQLEEVDYFDQVKLVVIDHKQGIDVFPNERLMMSPPFPEPRVIAIKNSRPPVSAVDDKGDDILPLISRRDRKYPENFLRLPYEGYTAPHSITLDLGDLSGAKNITLLFYGWVRYWNSNSVYNASQNGIALEQPSVEVRDKNGKWVRVMDDMGFPAGLLKTISVDLTNRFLSDDFTIRITTNLEIYWDQILVSTDLVPEELLMITELSPDSAVLGWLGYPIAYSPDGNAPFEYDYNNVKDTAAWRTQSGYYTRYGDVTELLQNADDKFVIMAHGEEISIGFDTNRLQALSPGWERDIFIYVDGFVKEMNPHTAYLTTITPLPFHGMSNYPYGEDETYPFDKDHLDYLERYNTRKIE